MDRDKCTKCEHHVDPSNEKTRWGMMWLWLEPGYTYPHRCEEMMCSDPYFFEHALCPENPYPKTWEEIISAFRGPKEP